MSAIGHNHKLHLAMTVFAAVMAISGAMVLMDSDESDAATNTLTYSTETATVGVNYYRLLEFTYADYKFNPTSSPLGASTTINQTWMNKVGYSFSDTSSTSKNWIRYNGYPTEAGTHNIEITITDPNNSNNKLVLAWTVEVIDYDPTPIYYVGQTANIMMKGMMLSLEVPTITGTLPSGTSMVAIDGYPGQGLKLQGTFTTPGTYTFSYTANSQQSGTFEYTFYVLETGTTINLVSFLSGSGTGSMQTMAVTSGDSITLPQSTFVPPTGKEFDNWKAPSGNTYNAGNSFVPTENISFTAQYKDIPVPKWVVYYNSGVGMGTMDPTYVDQGSSFTIPQSTFTAPENKIYAGWKIDNEGQLYLPGESYTPEENMVFYAQWNDIATAEYHLVTFVIDEENSIVQTVSVESGSSVTILSFQDIDNPPLGNTLTGWKINNDGEIYSAGAEYVPTANTTFYAQWEGADPPGPPEDSVSNFFGNYWWLLIIIFVAIVVTLIVVL